jgi:hypothetical protein
MGEQQERQNAPAANVVPSRETAARASSAGQTPGGFSHPAAGHLSERLQLPLEDAFREALEDAPGLESIREEAEDGEGRGAVPPWLAVALANLSRQVAMSLIQTIANDVIPNIGGSDTPPPEPPA